MISLNNLTESEYIAVDRAILTGLKNDYGTKADEWDKPVIKNNKYSILLDESILKYIDKKHKDKVGSRLEDESEKIQKFKDKINK